MKTRDISERDINILKPLVEKELKRVSKLALEERNHFGKGFAFDEIEHYMRLMLEDFNELLGSYDEDSISEEEYKKIEYVIERIFFL